jgi:hypothetical protein
MYSCTFCITLYTAAHPAGHKPYLAESSKTNSSAEAQNCPQSQTRRVLWAVRYGTDILMLCVCVLYLCLCLYLCSQHFCYRRISYSDPNEQQQAAVNKQQCVSQGHRSLSCAILRLQLQLQLQLQFKLLFRGCRYQHLFQWQLCDNAKCFLEVLLFVY